RRQAARPMRDWRTQPFSRRSPWNHPIGSAARYATIPRLASYMASLNYEERWTSAIVLADAQDPLVEMVFSPNWGAYSSWAFLNRGGKNCGNGRAAEQNLLRHATPELPTEANYYSTTASPDDSRWALPASYRPASDGYRGLFRLPAGACPSPDTDGMMAVFQPDGWAIDIYATVVTSDGHVVGTMASWIDARGDGTGWWNGRRASMLPSFAGLIRSGEIASGRIPHALAVQVPAAMLREQSVWPAYAFDRDSGYSGSVPMGALLAIPPQVDLASLGLSPFGLVIARAAQDYGVYVVDRGGAGITFLAELGNPDIRWQGRGADDPAWWKDIETIKNALKRVTNNGPTSRGGGGVPRVPLAPHLTVD
ncbi:MAG: hypothetical protein ACRERC_02835, partial [Candidatus Binatia bacterium]